MKERARAAALGVLLAASAGVALSLAVFVGLPAAMAEVRDAKGVAVVVGNRNYRNDRVPEVSYAHRDAAAFRHYVVEVLGYDPDNVIDLKDADQATLESVFGNNRSHEGKLWRYLDPEGGSDVVVFYSGHGVPGLKDKRAYLLPVNADPDTAEINGYPIDVLYKNLSKLKDARSVRVFLDACFSGDSDRGMLVRAASPVFVKAELPKALKKLTVLTAASGQELASWDEKAEHGLFTNHLLDALYGKADGVGDGKKDGKVTAAEAKRYLDRHMTRAARRTFGRYQNATLAGNEAVVLAAVPLAGGFAARPMFKPGSLELIPPSGGSGTVEAPSPSFPPSPAPPAGHAAAEKALGLKRGARVLVQRGLGLLKFDAGPADGLFGKKTRGAIKAWQEAKGFEATGYLTAEQAEALRAVGGEVKVAVGILPKPKKPVKKGWQAGEIFKDCDDCPQMVVVPAGEFMMGSPDWEGGRDDDEGPRHRVTMPRAFAVGRYEVTVAEYRRFVRETGSSKGSGCYVWDRKWKKEAGRSWENPGFSQGSFEPVVCVSWEDAQAYAGWLSDKTGKEYRLLSEAEWEYAARAGTRTSRYWGNSEEAQCKHANGADQTAKSRYSHWTAAACRDGAVHTANVGSYGANRFGLSDMLGNVSEWVEDCWHGNYEGAPEDGSAWVSGGDCERRVLRGGSWVSGPWFLRSANRFRNSPGSRGSYGGFRIARTLTP